VWCLAHTSQQAYAGERATGGVPMTTRRITLSCGRKELSAPPVQMLPMTNAPNQNARVVCTESRRLGKGKARAKPTAGGSGRSSAPHLCSTTPHPPPAALIHRAPPSSQVRLLLCLCVSDRALFTCRQQGWEQRKAYHDGAGKRTTPRQLTSLTKFNDSHPQRCFWRLHSRSSTRRDALVWRQG
jgi:hypothetical protein